MSDTITLSRTDYDALIERIEDAEDKAAIAAHHDEVRTRGIDAVLADSLSVESVKRLIQGEHPVRVWRKHRGMRAITICEQTGIAKSYLSAIENGKKPGSLDAMIKIARVLKIPVEDLVASTD